MGLTGHKKMATTSLLRLRTSLKKTKRKPDPKLKTPISMSVEVEHVVKGEKSGDDFKPVATHACLGEEETPERRWVGGERGPPPILTSTFLIFRSTFFKSAAERFF